MGRKGLGIERKGVREGSKKGREGGGSDRKGRKDGKRGKDQLRTHGARPPRFARLEPPPASSLLPHA